MTPTREAAYAALFALASTAAAFITTGRRLKLWTEVPPSAQPALFQSEQGETYQPHPRALPRKITLDASLFVYASNPSDDTPAALNAILDALSDALEPGPTADGVQTLGGVVSHCWIEGRVFKDPGDLDGQALAIVPVKILLP